MPRLRIAYPKISPLFGLYPFTKSAADIFFFPSGCTSNNSRAASLPAPTSRRSANNRIRPGGTNSDPGVSGRAETIASEFPRKFVNAPGHG